MGGVKQVVVAAGLAVAAVCLDFGKMSLDTLLVSKMSGLVKFKGRNLYFIQVHLLLECDHGEVHPLKAHYPFLIHARVMLWRPPSFSASTDGCNHAVPALQFADRR